MRERGEGEKKEGEGGREEREKKIGEGEEGGRVRERGREKKEGEGGRILTPLYNYIQWIVPSMNLETSWSMSVMPVASLIFSNACSYD